MVIWGEIWFLLLAVALRHFIRLTWGFHYTYSFCVTKMSVTFWTLLCKFLMLLLKIGVTYDVILSNTETALLRVTNDILLNMNSQRVTLLIQLLDLSAAFDIIDYNTLLHRLRFSFDIHEKVLSWCKSYFSRRSQQVLINDILSDDFSLKCDVPQRSCLVSILFKLYTSKLSEIVKLICLMFIVMSMIDRFTFRLVLILSQTSF